MKNVNDVLKQFKVNKTALSEELNERIVNLQAIIKKYNNAVKENKDEEDEEIEKQLDELEQEIKETDTKIAADVKTYLENKEKEKSEPKVEQPKVEQPKVELPKVEEPKVEEPKVEEQPKKKDSTGWLIFGGIVLLATLGVVNVMKKK